MIRIFWLNLNTGQLYYRYYGYNSFYSVGNVNGNNHIVVDYQVYDRFDFKSYKDDQDYYHQRISLKKEETKKEKAINKIIDFLEKIKK